MTDMIMNMIDTVCIVKGFPNFVNLLNQLNFEIINFD